MARPATSAPPSRPGIIGAVVFRLILIFAGVYLMRTFFFLQFIRGAFLLHTGVTTITTNKKDGNDPSQKPTVRWLQKHFSVVKLTTRRPVSSPNV
jgi:tellurite resistance protein TerC